MPIIKSAKKRLRQNQKLRLRNKVRISSLRTLMKKTSSEKDPNKASELLKEVYSSLDKAAQRHIIHPKKASRQKAQLARIVGHPVKQGTNDAQKETLQAEESDTS